jgi:putative flippase GtrA
VSGRALAAFQLARFREGILLFGRFFSTALAGLILDLAVAWVLIVVAGVGDVVAASCGLLVGMVVAYAGHLLWTFRAAGRQASLGHFAQFAAGAGISLAVRVAVLSAIEWAGWQELLPALVRLSLGAGLSFVVSYFLCRFVIFRPVASG